MASTASNDDTMTLTDRDQQGYRSIMWLMIHKLETGGYCKISFPHLKLKSREFSFVQSIYFSFQTVLQICTENELHWHSSTLCIISKRFDNCALEFMMASSNGNRFRVTGTLGAEFIGHQWILSQRQLTWIFDVFFVLPWTNDSANNRDASDLRRHRTLHVVSVMSYRPTRFHDI